MQTDKQININYCFFVGLFQTYVGLSCFDFVGGRCGTRFSCFLQGNQKENFGVTRRLGFALRLFLEGSSKSIPVLPGKPLATLKYHRSMGNPG